MSDEMYVSENILFIKIIFKSFNVAYYLKISYNKPLSKVNYTSY